MSSLRDHEGYLFIDHSQTLGLTEAEVHQAGLPPGAGRGVFECATFTCSHCQAVVIINPQRNRERAYCRGCDHLLCDNCGAARAAGAKCKPFKQVIDEILAAAEGQANASGLILP